MQAILDSAKEHGVIAHRFYGSDDGQIMVVDEWPDEQSFQSFFQENGERIGAMMQHREPTVIMTMRLIRVPPR